MSRVTLGIVGILLILLGIAGLATSWEVASAPAWVSWSKIVIGLISVVVVATDTKE